MDITESGCKDRFQEPITSAAIRYSCKPLGFCVATTGNQGKLTFMYSPSLPVEATLSILTSASLLKHFF